MLTENAVFGFVEPDEERGGAAALGFGMVRHPALRLATYRVAGVRRKPQDFIAFLRAHAARGRRRAMPTCAVSLQVAAPSGMRSVEIIFGDA